ncbi:hypothetical protein [Alloactinosynnema sp. L-07]|nr:hypothetical protein [Alloactinosynnema sp. L-07]
MLAELATASPVIRHWHRWTRLFAAFFPVGTTCQYAGLLTLALNGPLALAGVLLITGMTAVSVMAIHLARTTEDALTIAANLATTEQPHPIDLSPSKRVLFRQRHSLRRSSFYAGASESDGDRCRSRRSQRI